MRLVTFEYGGQLRLGAMQRRGGRELVTDLNRLDSNLPNDMIAFLQAGPSIRNLAQEILKSSSPDAEFDTSGVTLKAPIPRPGKIICLGQNYREHNVETGSPLPKYPIIFTKYANCVVGSGEPIVLPRVTNQVDYEGELAVVIGRTAKDVVETKALDYVTGYMPINDVSARDYQHRTSQWTIGKTFDTFAPMGPALVTSDEIPDPQNLRLRTTIGGEILQDGNTCDMIFSVAYVIAYLSSVMTLEPGDVIATGTPSGIGEAHNPPRWLLPGDIVRVEIEGLGVLENPVIAQE